MRTYYYLRIIFNLCFLSGLFLAGGISKAHTINWLPPYEKIISSSETFRSLNFSGASFDENFMPLYIITEPISNSTVEIKSTLKNIITEPFNDENLIRNPELIESDFKVISRVVTQKKKSFSSISILPIRKNSSGRFERLVSFDIDINPVYSSARISSVHSYTSSSVLASGDWYKIAVLQTGIFKIDYLFLKSMGIDVDQIDPKNIKIFGNGGGSLPLGNNKFRYDDLQENAILVSGEADSHFDTQDFVAFYGTSQTKWTYNAVTNQFNHQVNLYADTTYYFLTIGLTPGKRVQQRSSVPGGNVVVNSFDDYIYHEAELYNFLKSGREWYGESMDNLNTTLSLPTISIPNLINSDSINFRSNLGGRSVVVKDGPIYSSSFTLNINGANMGVLSFQNVGSSVQDNYLVPVTMNKIFIPSGSNINIKYILSTTNPNGQGWLNNFEMNFRRNLSSNNMGSQFSFIKIVQNIFLISFGI